MKPKKLKAGDTIGVVATSDPITEEYKEEINRAVAKMNGLGVNVKFGKYAFNDPTGYGETAKHKAEDINEMFQNKEIAGIFCAMRRV